MNMEQTLLRASVIFLLSLLFTEVMMSRQERDEAYAVRNACVAPTLQARQEGTSRWAAALEEQEPPKEYQLAQAR